MEMWRELSSGQFMGKKSRDPIEKPQEMADYVFYPHKKITSLERLYIYST
jgi:hypothetical protein